MNFVEKLRPTPSQNPPCFSRGCGSRAVPSAEILDRYRIVTNGETGDNIRYKVQRRGWLYVWHDCPTAGNFMSISSWGFSIGIYSDLKDAEAAVKDLASGEMEDLLKRF